MTDFFTAVQTRQHEKNTRICLGLDPDFRNPQFKSNPQAVLDWATALIEKTAPEICCVKPQAAFFYALKADITCLLYTSPSPRDATLSRMPSSA